MMLIADDFGLGRGHDKIILDLLEAGKIDGTSVLINDSILETDIERLISLHAAGAKVGLHLNLTQPLPGYEKNWSLKYLLWPLRKKSILEIIGVELVKQLNAFQLKFGFAPDYYDGHQHCHCFPAVAPQIVKLITTDEQWVRVPLPDNINGFWLNLCSGGSKTLIIWGLSLGAKYIFRKSKLKTNKNFSGFLRLDNPALVGKWLPKILLSIDAHTVVMVHPGDGDDPVQCYRHAAMCRTIEANILRENSNR